MYTKSTATTRYPFLAAMLTTVVTGVAAAVAASAPNARAVGFEEKVIFRTGENPGFAAWVQLWPEAKPDELMIKFLTRRQPKAGERVEAPPLDPHYFEAIGLPAKYDFSRLVNEVVYMRSKDNAATWQEVGRTTEIELNQSPDGGSFSPVRLPDGRLLSLSWGMPGYLRESTDGGKSWNPLRELMDPAFYDVAPFTIRLLSDRKTLVIFCPYTHAWGKGRILPGRLHTKPGVRAAWQAALIFSDDFGKTLSPPLPIYPGVPVTETDFVELPSGDLLFIHAKLFGAGKAHRQVVRRTKFGWIAEEMEEIDPAAPETFVRTNEGYLVGASRNDPYVWSDDDGLTWQAVADIPRGEYQPRALLLKDNRILFAWHKGGDFPYGQADMYIGQHIFKLKADQPRTRSHLKLARVFDARAGKYVCSFDATLTTVDGKPIAGKPIEFSVVARDAQGYEPFGGATPWVHGAKQSATTDEHGVVRVSYPEQHAITDIHRSFQVAARFDPDRADDQFSPATSLTIEYYAVTPSAEKP